MLRRLLACLLTLALLAPAALSETLPERLSAIAMIDQNAAAYRDKAYRYNGAAFPTRGCGPASIANALCLLLNVTDQAEADQLLVESMKLFTNSHQPAKEIIDIKRMERLTGDLGASPLLQSRLNALNAALHYEEALLSPALLLSALEEAGEKPLLLLCRISLTEQWADVAEVCRLLRDAGHGDAWLLAVYASAGTSVTVAPFRGGESGHYITVAFEAGALLDTCAFYVLDSNPRALSGEAFGPGEPYADHYTLVRREGRLAYDFSLSHLRPGVVAAQLRPARQETLDALTPQAAAAQRLSYLEEMLVFGRASCWVYVP